MSTIVHGGGGGGGTAIKPTYSNSSSNDQLVHFDVKDAEIGKTYYLMTCAKSYRSGIGGDNQGLKNTSGIDTVTVVLNEQNVYTTNSVIYTVYSFKATATEFSGDVQYGSAFYNTAMNVMISEYGKFAG